MIWGLFKLSDRAARGWESQLPELAYVLTGQFAFETFRATLQKLISGY